MKRPAMSSPLCIHEDSHPAAQPDLALQDAPGPAKKLSKSDFLAPPSADVFEEANCFLQRQMRNIAQDPEA